jgi:hypothetical protein
MYPNTLYFVASYEKLNKDKPTGLETVKKMFGLFEFDMKKRIISRRLDKSPYLMQALKWTPDGHALVYFCEKEFSLVNVRENRVSCRRSVSG